MADGDDEGPISVPVEEPTEEEKEHWRREAALGEQITASRDNLRTQLEWVRHQANAVSTPMPVGALVPLAGELSGIAGMAQTAQSGLHDGSYALNAFHQVAYWANHAAGIASGTASLDTDTALNAALADVQNSITNALGSLQGV